MTDSTEGAGTIQTGTSTQEDKINPDVMAEPPCSSVEEGKSGDVATTSANKPNPEGKKTSSHSHSIKKNKHRCIPRLKNIDRSSGQTREVTVNNITVLITEYKPKAISVPHSDSGSSDVEFVETTF